MLRAGRPVSGRGGVRYPRHPHPPRPHPTDRRHPHITPTQHRNTRSQTHHTKRPAPHETRCGPPIAAMIDTIRDTAGCAVATAGVDLPVVPEQIPVLHFSEALDLVGASPHEPDLAPEHERLLGKWAKAQFDPNSLPSRDTRRSNAPSTPTPNPTTHDGPTHSTYSSAASNSRPAGNAYTTMPTTLRRWPTATKTRPTMPPTSKRWDMACPRTAGSLSAWNGGPPASSKPTTSDTPPSSLGISIGFALRGC